MESGARLDEDVVRTLPESGMAYLRNAWYVVAWSDEISDAFLARRIMGEPMMFYRREDGGIAAIADRCPHRFVPLHLGRRHGDVVECAYHGLRFAPDGRCVLNPNSDTIPSKARVRSWPVVERHRLVFAWMGAAEEADPGLVPDFSFMDDERLATTHGYIHGDSHYMLMVDNILDLSHAQYLHADTLGSPALAKALPKIVEAPRHVDVLRWMPDDYQAPLTAASRGFADRRCDAWMDTRWHPPGYMHMETGLVEVGGPREQGRVSHALHLITPETDTTNHYFWANARAFATDDHALTRRIHESFGRAFEHEDKPILAAQQESMGDADLWDLDPVLLVGDAAAVRVRRRLDRMIAEETGDGSRPGLHPGPTSPARTTTTTTTTNRRQA